MGPGSEPYRPAYHFSAAANWLNDPNGLVLHRGAYHLFFQHNPDDVVWGNLSWGHATSPDLVHWTEHPVAIRYADGEAVFSGSVVADDANTSGFGTAGSPPLVAMYTSVHAGRDGQDVQAQSLAYSTDDGATWTRHAGNPVLDLGLQDFRDPKVFWFAPTGDWRVVLALPERRQVVIYRSPDLRHWTFVSDIGPLHAADGVWECPDLFPLAVDGDPSNVRWVLLVSVNPGGVAGGSGTQYVVGDFDGTTFKSDTGQPQTWLDHGPDNYAGVTFDNTAPTERVLVGWMNNWEYAATVPTAPWRGEMTLPRMLSLVTTDDGIRLRQQPIDGADAIAVRSGVTEAIVEPVDDGVTPLDLVGDVARVDLSIELGTATSAGLVVRRSDDGGHGTRIGVHRDGTVLLDRRESGVVGFHPRFAGLATAPVEGVDGQVRLTVYLDRSSVEVFADGGRTVLTALVYPDPSSAGFGVWSAGGRARRVDVRVTPLAP